MSLDPEYFRAKAREFALKAQQAKDHHGWQSMTALARSNVLLEVNARWLASTDRFIEARSGPDKPIFQRTLASSECGPRLTGSPRLHEAMPDDLSCSRGRSCLI